MKLFALIICGVVIFTSTALTLNHKEQKEGPKSFTVEIKEEPNPAQIFEQQLLSQRKSKRRTVKKTSNSPRDVGSASRPSVSSGMFVK